jgi:two-component system sensor histidine kinase/response regulator
MSTPAPAVTDRPGILMVDDHPANLLALESVLQPLGYDLVRAQSGEEALLKSLQRDFVLIVMDVHMPTLDGYHTVEMLRGRPRSRDIPIIFLTVVYNLEEHAHRGYALGAADYITKPFDPVVLRAKVSALVALYTRGRREEQARHAELERFKDLFLCALGHDLRNPLHSIIMAARLVKEDGTASAESRRQRMEVIEGAALRMNAMLDDILDLTAAKFSGAMPVKIEPVDLASVCRNVVAEIQSVHPDRSISVDVSGDVTGRWDATRLARVVSNLVGNAIHHAPEASVNVRLVSEGDRVSIVVHNDGPGIAPELLPRLFEPFRRGETSAEGLGLGLYIVREIVRAHGGDVEVHSSDAEGTRFIVAVPRRPSPTRRGAGRMDRH